jgi:hypothetical protein
VYSFSTVMLLAEALYCFVIAAYKPPETVTIIVTCRTLSDPYYYTVENF